MSEHRIERSSAEPNSAEPNSAGPSSPSATELSAASATDKPLRRDALHLGLQATLASCLAGSMRSIGISAEPKGSNTEGGELEGDKVEVGKIKDLEIIDCHTHFYDPTRSHGVPWPPKDSPLYRKVMPEDMRQLPQYRRVSGTVIVEASEWIEDNQWLLDLAKDDPWIVGIVGRLDPSVAKFGEQLRRFAANPLYRGIRIWEDRLRDLLTRNELGSFKLMADLGITADVNGSPDVLDLAAELSKRVSGLTIALNHIGNVAITDAAPPESWKKSIVAASKSSNIYCKISALAEGAGREGRKAPDDLEFYRPTLDVVWNAFGADRVIYGSNWPVCEVAADYQKVQRLSMDYISEKGEDSLRKFCSSNSVDAYRWMVR